MFGYVVAIVMGALFLGAFFYSGQIIIRDVIRGLAPDERLEAVLTRKMSWSGKLRVIAVALFCSTLLVGFQALHASFAVRGEARSIVNLRNGDYRVVYLSPGGLRALIAPIGGGEPIYYALEGVGLPECFRVAPRSAKKFEPLNCPPRSE